VLESWAEAIVPTKNKDRGEWKITVDREAHMATMEWLHEHWVDILELIPTEISNASPFDNPKITSKSRNHPETESEEGTVNTYGTILSSLYYGTDNEEAESESSEAEPTATAPKARPVTYAQVIRDGNISTVSQVSGWTDHRNEEFVQLQEKHSSLEEKFQSVTAELSELKDLLQQLLAQGQCGGQAAPEPPQKKQATFNTPQRVDRNEANQWLQNVAMELEYGPDATDPEAGKSSKLNK